jgi:hypothetical protein
MGHFVPFLIWSFLVQFNGDRRHCLICSERSQARVACLQHLYVMHESGADNTREAILNDERERERERERGGGGGLVFFFFLGLWLFCWSEKKKKP